MRRVARRLFTACSVWSALLCGAMCVARAFGQHGTLVLRDGGGGIGGGSSIATYALFTRGGTIGLGWTRSDVWFEGGLSIPLGFVLAANALLAAWLAVLHRQRRWSDVPGVCPSCGYDLRASPDRCPECGTVVATKEVA